MSQTPAGRLDSFAVAQLGARMHYAIPRILYGSRMLEGFYTDLVVVKGWPGVARRLAAAGLRTGSLRRMAARVPDGLPPGAITHWPGFALEYFWRKRRARSPGQLTATHLWAGREFCRRIIRHGLGQASAAYTFNCAGF